ncbi:uncharacterized protein Z518_01517 [Rhinocladiella mackenziei CBS 650.93]|uniref:RNA helicase n=1 Tax=Rhinocladiella mackenziei CBS 650.93 TaxID=1442369 RepID=A0A0D2JLT7_9EURO|nr:uncharacterized protein Z518_01517 [Rhinocladiella mackenziei CBS 650.93]KIX10435.1 hypothetical protein Z518_01517 [Rhinocladiella mackenziei CBS 650.93]
MAPNKKKKKSAANPARGFATTSLPSKARPPDKPNKELVNIETGEKGQHVSAAPAESAGGQITGRKGDESSEQTSDIKNMSPEDLEAHLENSELEALVEKYAMRSMAEARRQVTKLETERRQLRSQAYRLSTYNWLFDELVDEIFRMNDMDSISAWPVLNANSPSNDEERLMVDLWTLEKVLEALRFPRVADAIAYIAELAMSGRPYTVGDSLPGLYGALQWYSSGSQSAELSNYEQGTTSKSGQSGESTPLQESSEPISATQSRPSPTSTPAKTSEPEDDSLPSMSSSESDDDDDPSKLTEEYVRVQRLIWEVQNPHPSQDSVTTAKRQKRMPKLSRKVQNLRRDPLFDEFEAESAWYTSLMELQATHQKLIREYAARRREQTLGATKKTEDLDSEDGRPLLDNTESDGEDGNGLLGGIFGGSDEPDTASEDLGNTGQVKLVDFGKWTGVSPRKLLDDICKGHDPKSRIQLRILQSTSYSARHSVDVFWTIDTMIEDQMTAALPPEISAKTTPRQWSVEMTNISAASSIQSEAYICTLALFLVSSLGVKEQKAMTRLPTVWRDTVKDLTDEKRRLVDEEHKSSFRRIRALIQTTREKVKQEQTWVVSKDRTRPEGRHRIQRTAPSKLNSDRVSREWTLRTSRTSFQEMLGIRQQLPVHQFKDRILDCVADNPVTVICAETGAGKSSGIPVLLLEREFSAGRDCRILVIQPRRISAVTLARRVSQELGESRNDIGTARSLVGYAIRLESKTSSNTRITYATTGVLLRMLEESPDLDELDYLILDEVHERTMDLDLLFIALQKLPVRRKTLKIVLMSATVDASKFSAYFGGAPVLDLPGRTFPVQVGFLEDAVEATKDLAGLKDQTLLVQDEGQDYDDSYANEKSRPIVANPESYSEQTLRAISSMDEYRINYHLIVKLAAAIASKPKYAKYSRAVLIFMPGIGEMRYLHNLLLSVDTFRCNWVVHLLHSTFTTEELERAFDRPPLGSRKIVIATNIAETGITIPDVTAVIDTCKEKLMRFDERRQLSRLTEGFISRSSARQRRGRAARVQGGLCFHLVTKHRHDNLMLEQQVPEMLRLSLQDPVLRIKVWDLGSIEETLNAAIDPPSRKNVLRAIEKLKDAGALTKSEALTPLGQQISHLPLEVSLAKLAIFGVIFRCLDPILAVISLLTSKSPFLPIPASGPQADARQTFSRSDSDLLSSFNAYTGWKKAKGNRSGQEFCWKNHISDQTMSQVEEQKIQLLVYLVDAGLVILEAEERAALNRARTGSRGDGGVFYPIPHRYNQTVSDRALNSIIAMALYPRILMRQGKGWRNVYTNQVVSPTPRSINHDTHNAKPPRWLSFYEAMQNRSGHLNVFETSAIPESALALLLGEAEFEFFAGVLVLDSGKVRLSVRHWRQLMALKVMREHLSRVLDMAYRRPGEVMLDEEWKWVDLWWRMEASQE